MNNHNNARFTPHGRALLVRRTLEHGLRPAEAAQPENRYEHCSPGDLLHLDIKKLGRFRLPGPAPGATLLRKPGH